MNTPQKSICAAVLVLFAASAMALQNPEQAALRKAETKKLQGRWKVESFRKGGDELEAVAKLGLEFEFKDDKLTVRALDKGFTPQVRVFRLDVSTTPKLLDLAESAKDFGNVEKVIEGLYALDGDILKWCFNMEGDQPAKGNRPLALESKAGTSTVLIALRRVKD
jgi:uncharacterized protein (TIGR03067 family)